MILQFASRRKKKLAWLLILIISIEFVIPVRTLALTGGPSQPEMNSFEPFSTDQMVDISTGNFVYNIPLLEVGGYPINLAYHSGITMDQEASSVGLGWNINPGVIRRSVRGLPDDFSGDIIQKDFNMKDDVTIGAKSNANLQTFGIKENKITTNGPFSLSASLGAFYNNYRGLGFEFSFSPSISAGVKSGDKLVAGIQGSAGLGLSVNSQQGSTLAPSLSFSVNVSNTENQNLKLDLSASTPISSRQGLKQLNLRTNMGYSDEVQYSGKDKKGILHEGEFKRKIPIVDRTANFSFVGSTHIPTFSQSMINTSSTFSGTLGLEISGAHPNVGLTGYKSTQKILTEIDDERESYGTLYAHIGTTKEKALHDFQREKDIPFKEEATPSLPITIRNNDIYSLSGQGIGGSYILKRGDVGVVFDAEATNRSDGENLGVEVGGGNVAHGGTDQLNNMVNSISNKWNWYEGNQIATFLDYKDPTNSKANPGYEPSYFKKAGELVVESDQNFFDQTGGFDAVRAGLQSTGPMDVATKPSLVRNFDFEPNQTLLTNKVARAKRERRNETISFLTADEAATAALEKKINSYQLNDFPNASPASQIVRNTGNRKSHHLSEMTSVRADGVRYLYGIPAYNNSQEEITFSVDGSNADCQTGLVHYSPGVDDSKGNTKGRENYYENVKTPPYAHSFLLTAILSPDYTDLTGNGPTPDDYGQYTKINYSRVHENYTWRIPYQHNKAQFNPGLLTDDLDDKGNIIYGKKEVWFIHSIQSKTQVAEFHYDFNEDGVTVEQRQDGLGVAGKSGGKDLSMRQHKLSRIELYSYPNRLAFGTGAVPIKVAHFKYQYEICDGIPNSANNEGKLTLKKLWFTYGKSKKGKLSPYTFDYSNSNPNYNLRGYDRWGYYQDNLALSDCQDFAGLPSTAEYPYVNQKNTNYSNWAESWNLTQIQLPSGGKLNVNYEPHDYAYVQDKRAMQMFKITGLSSASSTTVFPNPTSQIEDLYTTNGNTISNKNLIYFELQDDLTGTEPSAKEELRKRYLSDILEKHLYFKCLVDVGDYNDYEYVFGYAKIKDFGVARSGGTDFTHGYVLLGDVCIKDKEPTNSSCDKINPITKSAVQFARLHRPDVAFNQPNINTSGFEQAVSAIAGMATSLAQLFEGINKNLIDKGYGKKLRLNRSWIRLYNPNGRKKGGGSRVQSIKVTDSWNQMAGGNNTTSEYGQEYTYTTKGNLNGINQTISSGVAAYEPLAGGEENPFRLPKFYDEVFLLAPDLRHYVEEPFGESFFPAPRIIYSEVKVQNIDKAGVSKNATGHQVYKYFTAKDYPTITKRTSLKYIPKKSKPLLTFLKIKAEKYLTASQGFAIELNDMHGKPKSKEIFDGGGMPVSWMKYHYNTDNKATVIHENGSIKKDEQIGVDFQMVADAREATTQTFSEGEQFNLESFLIGPPPPLIIPVPLMSSTSSIIQFRSMVITKLIHRYALLEKVTAFDLGTKSTTENLLWDAETGEVVLTKTYNEFKDPIYNFKYPAHWAYENMEGAYQNILAEIDGISISSNGIVSGNTSIISKVNKYISKGDRLLVDGSKEGWAYPTSSGFKLIDRYGNPITSGSKLKVIESGHKNQATLPIGSITSKNNPLDALKGNTSYFNLEILNSSAQEYWENWGSNCLKCGARSPFNNPFIHGTEGRMKPLMNWIYQTERHQGIGVASNSNTSTNIKEDGAYTNYSPFWIPQSNSKWQPNRSDWTWINKSTQYHTNGFELENVDILNRHSSEQIGYFNSLVTAVAANSKLKNMFFEGFEDYDYENLITGSLPGNSCFIPKHFDIQERVKPHDFQLTRVNAHSGKYSFQVPAQKKVSCNLGKIKSQAAANDHLCSIFDPEEGKYHLSIWVKNSTYLPASNKPALELHTDIQSFPFFAQGPIVEGWQQVTGTFEIPPNNLNTLVLDFSGDLGGRDFDDLRIHPYDASFRSFVYDTRSLKLTYELDDRNFYTKYEYDKEGRLVRIKKETERGIMTVQENRFGIQKQ